MKAKYDQIGKAYSTQRRSDPRIARQIFDWLENATRILNIGAGSGSYEPEGTDLIALEPSIEMISQRSENAYPVIQGFAEELPFMDKSFSHVMSILSMHHWTDRVRAFLEINRVATDEFIAITWNPASEPFWLTRDYFPEIFEADKKIFPALTEFKEYFDDLKVEPINIPHDCLDGFLASYWKRPEVYLNPKVRNSISTFSKLHNASVGLNKLREDLKSGAWKERNKRLLGLEKLDVGYIIIRAKLRYP